MIAAIAKDLIVSHILVKVVVTIKMMAVMLPISNEKNLLVMKKILRLIYVLVPLNIIIVSIITCFSISNPVNGEAINTYTCYSSFQTSGPGTLYSVFDCGPCNKIQCYYYFDSSTCHKYQTTNPDGGDIN